MIQTVLNGMITIMLAKFMLNDVPHALGYATQQRKPDKVLELMRFLERGPVVARIDRSMGALAAMDWGKGDFPYDVDEVMRLYQIPNRTDAVFLIDTVKEFEITGAGLSRPNPHRGVPSATVYHVTDKDNVDSIMKRGLLASETSSGMLFFFPTLNYARESGLTDMAILAVVLTGEEIDKCEIGEIFPDLYEGKFGEQPPADMSLRTYLEHPVPYGVPEISCTIVMIPSDRIRQVEVISRG